jgi:hypothetical protein
MDYHYPVVVSQSLTVLSLEADVRILPSGEKVTVLTRSLWPSSVCFPAVVVSQSLTVLSFEADARTLPSSEKDTAVTELLWPSSVCRQGSQLSLMPSAFFQCWALRTKYKWGAVGLQRCLLYN